MNTIPCPAPNENELAREAGKRLSTPEAIRARVERERHQRLQSLMSVDSSRPTIPCPPPESI